MLAGYVLWKLERARQIVTSTRHSQPQQTLRRLLQRPSPRVSSLKRSALDLHTLRWYRRKRKAASRAAFLVSGVRLLHQLVHVSAVSVVPTQPLTSAFLEAMRGAFTLLDLTCQQSGILGNIARCSGAFCFEDVAIVWPKLLPHHVAIGCALAQLILFAHFSRDSKDGKQYHCSEHGPQLTFGWHGLPLNGSPSGLWRQPS